MEMMERRAQEWPAGPIHTCWLSGRQTRLHTHPTPSSRQARKEGLPPIYFYATGAKELQRLRKQKGLWGQGGGVLGNAECAGRGRGRWTNEPS